MPQSYLVRNQQNAQSFLQGLQLAHQMLQFQHQDQQLRARQAFSEQKQTERYQLMLQNSYAEKALQYAHEADKIKSQNAVQWRQDYWNKTTTGYLQSLADQEKQLADVTKPENAWKFTPQTVQQARQRLNEINDKRAQIAQSTPSDWNEFHDPTPLLQPLQTPFDPQESAEAARTRTLGQGVKESQIQHNIASTNLANTRASQAGQNDPTLKGALKNRQNFIDASRGVYALGPTVNTQTGNITQGLDSFGQPIKNPTLDKAKQEWAKKSFPFLENLGNPQLVGPDVSELYKQTAPKFNNLSTFDDFHNWLNYLSKKDYTGEGGAEELKAARKLHKLVTGVDDPTLTASPSSEETNETEPDTEEGEEQ